MEARERREEVTYSKKKEKKRKKIILVFGALSLASQATLSPLETAKCEV